MIEIKMQRRVVGATQVRIIRSQGPLFNYYLHQRIDADVHDKNQDTWIVFSVEAPAEEYAKLRRRGVLPQTSRRGPS